MIGYRFWHLDLDEKKMPLLRSATASYDWTQNTVGETLDSLYEVDCKKHSYFDKETNGWVKITYNPDAEEYYIPNIGFWGFNSLSRTKLEAFEYDIPNVVGIVNGFGKIHIHENGFRSEFCQILGFSNKIPCMFHMENKANVYFYDEYGVCYCDQHEKEEILKPKPRVQYGHDKILKDLSNRYEAPILSDHEMRKLNGYR